MGVILARHEDSEAHLVLLSLGCQLKPALGLKLAKGSFAHSFRKAR